MRQQLVETTVDLMEEQGLSKVTVRAVAAAAGVNVAAINYYFGSKAELIQAALSQTVNHARMDLDELISAPDSDPRQGLQALLSYLLEGALNNPNIIHAHVQEMFAGGASREALPAALAPTVDAVTATLAASVPLPEQRARQRAVAALSAVIFPSFFQSVFASTDVLKDLEARSEYVAEVVTTAFAKD